MNFMWAGTCYSHWEKKKLHQQQKLLGINGVLVCVQCDTIHTHTYTHTRVQMHVYWAKMVPCSIGSRTARFGFIISIHFDNFYGIRECLDIVSLYHILMWVCVYVCVRVCIVYTLAMFFAVSNPLSSSCFMAINVLWLFVIEIRFNDSD